MCDWLECIICVSFCLPKNMLSFPTVNHNTPHMENNLPKSFEFFSFINDFKKQQEIHTFDTLIRLSPLILKTAFKKNYGLLQTATAY